MIQTTVLANGVTVVTDQMDAVETVSVGIWVGAGSRHEPAGHSGLAHLIEHMAFKGTQRRSAQGIAEEIEAVGGQLNAYTSRENTAYFAKVLAEDMPLAVDLLADIYQHATLDADELERERQVILHELGQAIDQPDDIIFDRFQETAFPNQAVGRSVLGTPETVRALSRTSIAEHMRSLYTGERTVVAAAGRVDHDRFAALVEAALADLPARSTAAGATAAYRGGTYHEPRELEQTHMILGVPGAAVGTDAYYTEQVLGVLLGGGMSSRLFQEIREKRGLAYAICAMSMSFCDTGLFAVYGAADPEDAQEMARLVGRELAGVAATADEAEVARAKTQLKAQLLMAMESTGARCEAMGQHVLAYGRPLEMQELVARVEAVDVAAVRTYAHRLLTEGTPTLAVIGPESGAPSLGDLQQALTEAA